MLGIFDITFVFVVLFDLNWKCKKLWPPCLTDNSGLYLAVQDWFCTTYHVWFFIFKRLDLNMSIRIIESWFSSIIQIIISTASATALKSQLNHIKSGGPGIFLRTYINLTSFKYTGLVWDYNARRTVEYNYLPTPLWYISVRKVALHNSMWRVSNRSSLIFRAQSQSLYRDIFFQFERFDEISQCSRMINTVFKVSRASQLKSSASHRFDISVDTFHRVYV